MFLLDFTCLLMCGKVSDMILEMIYYTIKIGPNYDLIDLLKVGYWIKIKILIVAKVWMGQKHSDTHVRLLKAKSCFFMLNDNSK